MNPTILDSSSIPTFDLGLRGVGLFDTKGGTETDFQNLVRKVFPLIDAEIK